MVRSLAVLGAASAALYAGAVPAARRFDLEPLAVHVVVAGLLFLLQIAAIVVVHRGDGARRAVVAIVLGFGLLFRLLVVTTPVYLSSDLYRYFWDGRVQLAGVNPYRHPPSAPELADLRVAPTDALINRPWAPTVYPPGAQALFALTALALPATVEAWRVLLLAVDAGAVLLLLRLLRRLGRPPAMVVVYAWSPLIVYEGVQAGHVDLVLVPLVLLAVGWRAAGAPVKAGVALGLATLVKLYPAVLAVAWWRRGDVRFPAAVALTVALGYLPYAAGVGAGALGFLPAYLGPAEDHNIGLRALLTFPLGLTGEGPRAVAMAALFAALAVALVLIARAPAPGLDGLWQAGGRAAGAYLLLVPTSMHPWYAMWIVPFLAATPSAAWLYFTGALALSYVKYVVEPAPFPWWAWAAEYVPLYVLLGVAGWRAMARRRVPTLSRPADVAWR